MIVVKKKRAIAIQILLIFVDVMKKNVEKIPICPLFILTNERDEETATQIKNEKQNIHLYHQQETH